MNFKFFSGKGGVGKTTMACATALNDSRNGLKTLIITTDPASNLADVFETEIGHKITPIAGENYLWAMEIDPDRATEEYRERIIGPMRAMMPESVIKVLEEQFNSPCTTEIASFDRFTDFMTGDSAAAEYDFDVIIFDTAPTGHTIRLLELPVDWSKHIEESAQGTGNTCIGPVASIQENKAKYDKATALLTDPQKTTFYFVLQPEETSILETRRSSAELMEIGVRNIKLIVNGLLPEEVCINDFFKSRYEMQQRHLSEIHTEFSFPIQAMYLRNREIKGITGLEHIIQGLFNENLTDSFKKLKGLSFDSFEHVTPDSDVIAKLITPDSGITKSIFFTGKGGVGKTVVSCATAVHLSNQGYKTLLLTTDPASHIGEVLGQHVDENIEKIHAFDNLFSVIIDQEKATEEYKARILQESEGKYSDDMLLAMKEELESPCTVEMAAFDKFMQYVESDAYDVVVFDTAPTGHTLRLLELPFDYSDQVGMMISTKDKKETELPESGLRLKRIMDRLKDKNQAVFAFVMYPESTPVVEAYRAMLDLKEAGIPTQFVVANQVLPPELCTNEFFMERRAMQENYLHEIRSRFNLPVAHLELFNQEIIGAEKLVAAGNILYTSDKEAFAASN
jgi:arsenite-transporting ATPase